MYAHPFYRAYPSQYSYPPYAYPQSPYAQQLRTAAEEQAARERALAIAAQRARRHQYLPDEDEDSADEWEYTQLGPRERAYLDAQRKRNIIERMQRQREEEERQRQQLEQERRWQQELDRRQKEADAERAQLLEQRRRAQRQRHEAQARSQPQFVPINIRRNASHEEPSAETSSSPSRSIPISASHSPEETSPKSASLPKADPRPPRPQYDERHDHAASRIQQQYRIHRSHLTIQDIQNQFNSLKEGFTWPTTLDFQIPGSEEGHISVPASPLTSDDTDELMDVDGNEGKLAYTSANYAFHQYTDQLEKLLVKLDGVESYGDKSVRERRRNVVKDIEQETQRLDRYWRSTWRRYLEDEKKDGNNEEQQQQEGEQEANEIAEEKNSSD